MAPTARLFILLAIAIPVLAVPNTLYEVLPYKSHDKVNDVSEPKLVQYLLDDLRKQYDINDSCPPFGQPDNRTSVTVIGNTSWVLGGYASMVTPNHSIAPSFNLWLPGPKTEGRRLREKNMNHYLFECWGKGPVYMDEYTPLRWFVMLHERDAQWAGRPNYILCAFYEMVNEYPPMIKMVISANQSCYGLSNRINQSFPEEFRHFTDGSVALHFSKDSLQASVLRKKRSEEQGGESRFPDWAHGPQVDLKADENLIRYKPTFHEKNHIDYGQENDDGKYTSAETTGVEQYMQRSQRHTTVGISGFDHSSFHNSRSHKDQQSISYINTVKMFRTRIITVQNNTLDKDQLQKSKALGIQHDDSEKETNNEKKQGLKSK